MEKMNKEYPILSNWKFVFHEMYSFDHKYPWYIAVRSVAGFLAPFIAAVIPSVAISLVEKRADFLTFFGIMLVFVLGNMIMGIISTKYDFIIKKKNYKVLFQSVQKKVISKIMTVDYQILESAEGKRLADGAKYSYSVEWNGWSRIMDMFTPFAFNLLGIIVYTIILIPVGSAGFCGYEYYECDDREKNCSPGLSEIQKYHLGNGFQSGIFFPEKYIGYRW